MQLAVILGVTGAVIRGLDRLRSALLAYLAVATVLAMETANTYIYFNSTPVLKHSATRATAAGAVISSIANLLLILCVSMYEEKEVIGPKPMAPPKPSIPSAVI